MNFVGNSGVNIIIYSWMMQLSWLQNTEERTNLGREDMLYFKQAENYISKKKFGISAEILAIQN